MPRYEHITAAVPGTFAATGHSGNVQILVWAIDGDGQIVGLYSPAGKGPTHLQEVAPDDDFGGYFMQVR